MNKPRVVWEFNWQDMPNVLDIFSDSNWAGCRRTRKSTSGGAAVWGSHTLKTWSKTQALVAKSSGEAELYGIVRGACEGLGLSTLFKDLGCDVKVRVHIDASAAKGMVERRELSKVRHLDVDVLWLQEQQARRLLPLEKIPGTANPADLMTKHLSGKDVEKYMKTLNIEFE